MDENRSCKPTWIQQQHVTAQGLECLPISQSEVGGLEKYTSGRVPESCPPPIYFHNSSCQLLLRCYNLPLFLQRLFLSLPKLIQAHIPHGRSWKPSKHWAEKRGGTASSSNYVNKITDFYIQEVVFSFLCGINSSMFPDEFIQKCNRSIVVVFYPF